jgi:hypothetical protein
LARGCTGFFVSVSRSFIKRLMLATLPVAVQTYFAPTH